MQALPHPLASPLRHLSAALLGLVLPLVPPVAGSSTAWLQKRESAAREPGDKDLERVWAKLSREDKQEIVQWFSAEAEYLGTFQNGLIKYLLERQERAPHLWPEAPSEPPVFDPVLHAPAQPIARRPLSESRTKRFREKVLLGTPERALKSAWIYDYGARMPMRTAPLDDLERTFENALQGFPPLLDYAEVLLEQRLDDGSLQKHHQAFAHAYSDREGGVVPGVTLFDAWASGTEIEMPDVECLGIVHLIEDDWKTWRAPVPDSQQDALYERIGEHFVSVRRYRGLRNALARVYLSGEPIVRDGYEANIDRFHALWEKHNSRPDELAAILPEGEQWLDWLEQTGRELDTSLELWEGGQRRKRALVADRSAVRATLVRVLREFGALKH